MRITVATCAYPAARTYAEDWIAGALAAAAGVSRVNVVVVNDGLPDPAAVFARLSDTLALRIVEAPQSASISEVRKRMLSEACRGDADGIVFCDMDDVLTEEAITSHATALTTHAISVGDLMPFGAVNGELLGSLFGAHLPQVIGARDLAATNICGFSNTAVRRETLRSVVGLEWPDIVAVDWWMFATLLDADVSAAGMRSVVARYRQHEANAVGAGSTADIVAAQRRLAIVAEYHRARRTTADLARARAAEALERDPRLGAIVAEDRGEQGPWYADVARWLTEAELEAKTEDSVH